eukprot:7805073-Alexandrium_andersonii.AAC.1
MVRPRVPCRQLAQLCRRWALAAPGRMDFWDISRAPEVSLGTTLPELTLSRPERLRQGAQPRPLK